MKDEIINGARVRERRDALDISREKLAGRIAALGGGKVSYQAIAQLEGGEVEKPKYAMYLPKALQTSWEYLIGRTDNPTPSNVNESAINTASNGVPPQKSTREEGTQVLLEISRMLGSVEGSLKAAFNARFDSIDKKLENHERRLEAVEERLAGDPQKGRRR